ncbi:MAG TPA: rod shape-determining protein [Clostridiales bacterium]|nr:rod shape-determining protein [Clostridiales bacterium]
MANMDIGIDLGTANIVMTMGNKGVILTEPSVVAFNKRTKRVLAVGNDAYKMIGRTPEYIVAIRPLSDGIISDEEMTQCMIREFILKVSGRHLIKPRIIICVPSLITEVENKAVVEAALSAGSRKVYLIKEPIAALIGAGVKISNAKGNMVVDIGGGTVDVAVISLSGIVTSNSLKVAGNKIDQAIIKYVMSRYKVLIGDKTAEATKKEMTNLCNPNPKNTMIIKGRSLISGMPVQLEISEVDIYNAIEETVFSIIDAIKGVLEETPPELIGDIYDNGIILTGGGALLGGIPNLISREVGVKCVVADDPILCVAKGTGMAFKSLNSLLDGFEYVSQYKYR